MSRETRSVSSIPAWSIVALVAVSIVIAPHTVSANTNLLQEQAATAKLADGDVVDMAKAGLSDNVIIAKIEASSCDFDTSPKALNALRSAQVSNAVIAAMVRKARGKAGEDKAMLATTPQPNQSPAAGAPAGVAAEKTSKGCLAVKSAGSHAFRNIVLLGVAGALISHQQYKVVYAEGYPAKIGQKYHGNDLQTIQTGGTRVVILAKHYTSDELQKACH